MIEIEQLSKSYGRRVGISGLTLDVPAGSTFGFLGPNGAGKTTTIRLLLGFLRPTEGRASVFGRDCWSQSKSIKAELGYLPGDLRMYSWMTGLDALYIIGHIRGRSMLKKGSELADYFGLDLSVRVRSMSRGMRQKLGLILALAPVPKLLVLDEPTASLDPLTQERLCDHLKILARDGHTIFFSSHVLSEVEDLCDRVAILREGTLVVDELLEKLRERARRSVTIRFKTSEAAAKLKPPDNLQIIERRERQWRGSLQGTAPVLLKWLSEQPIEDVSIGPPDLDSLFREFYRDDEDHR